VAGRRIERLNEQLKREITDILRNEARDPRIGVVTVTRAQASPDLTLARVFVSIMGDADEKAATLEGLTAALPFVRSELSRRMRSIRRVPELRFEVDHSFEHAMHIERLLSEVLPRNSPTNTPEPPADADGDHADA
jgi:ribosome-binding factor A